MKKSLHSVVRALHRDIGFFVIGLTVLYCVSGVSLLYRLTSYEPPAWLRACNRLHKMFDSNPASWITWIYAAMLIFLALSSFWMLPRKSPAFKRGLLLAGGGLLFSVVAVWMANV